MKNVILSADGDRIIYSVPDAVADDLRRYCLDFCTKWIHTDPRAKKYRISGGVCYDQDDFIDYLNAYLFPNERSVKIKNLGCVYRNDMLPPEYRDIPSFNF